MAKSSDLNSKTAFGEGRTGGGARGEDRFSFVAEEDGETEEDEVRTKHRKTKMRTMGKTRAR